MGDAELVEALKEARREAFNLRLRNATGELENTARLKPEPPRRGPTDDGRPPARDRPRQGTEVEMAEEENEQSEETEARRGRPPRGGCRGGAAEEPPPRLRPRRPRRPPPPEEAPAEEAPAEAAAPAAAGDDRRRARGARRPRSPRSSAAARALAHTGEAGPAAVGRGAHERRAAERQAQGRRAPPLPPGSRRRPRQGRRQGLGDRHRAGRARARQPEGPPGHRRLRQDGQDDHRPRRERPPPPLLREGDPDARRCTTRTTSATRPAPGDTVRLVETRPMSKTKHWRLTEILEKAK